MTQNKTERNTPDFQSLCDIALSVAEQAGDAIQAYKAKHEITVLKKTTGTSEASQVLTEADRQAQEIIINGLKKSISEFDLGLLSEESTDDESRLRKEYFWCIDPLDGTLPFIQGHPGYAVSIALVRRDGTPIIGVVRDPVQKVSYHAILEKGAFRNGLAWQTDNLIKDKTFDLYIDTGFRKYDFCKEVISASEEFLYKNGFKNIRITQDKGAVLNAIGILESPDGGYFKFPKKTDGCGSLWDFAATACIANELGFSPIGFNNKPLALNNPETTFMNKNGAIYSNFKPFSEFVLEYFQKRK
ncbi:inositol monophosphatase (plasmid) [Fulvitalea axinellae]|uniref:Inositol monophosphatase n=1 Tax=Fulvitalea axinellae TaxID=1182444 RepID=A0AAU9DMC0_9BACT|nr:inositol monophosphatase [Fulvitalea axinellae]